MLIALIWLVKGRSELHLSYQIRTAKFQTWSLVFRARELVFTNTNSLLFIAKHINLCFVLIKLKKMMAHTIIYLL